MLQATVEEESDGNYVEEAKDVNRGCSTDIMLLINPVRTPLEKGVKQGERLSFEH